MEYAIGVFFLPNQESQKKQCLKQIEKILKDLNLEINEGDFIIIVGLSGAGKSTLLRTINNLVKPTNGTVYLEGKDVTNAKKRDLKNIRSQIGMIFQTFNLVNRSTVLKNVLTGRLSLIHISEPTRPY